MNRINPLYIGLLLVGILLFLLTQLSSAKKDLKDAKSEHQVTTEIVNELGSLKSVYGSKAKVKKALKRILALSSLKSADIKESSTKSGINLSSSSMDKVALDALMGKLLNGAYNIEKFKIKKIDDKKVSFEMEIKW